MATIETLFKITAAVVGANAVKELGEAVKGVQSNGEKLSASFATASRAIKGFIAAAAVKEMVEFVGKQVELADHMNDLRQRTGVAVETLSEYKVAAEKAGTSLDDVAGALQKFNKNTIAAQVSTSEQAQAFRALGISAKEVKSLNTEQLLDKIANQFAATNDGAAKTAIAMALFGKSGASLIPMLNEGAKSLHEFNAGIDQNFATASDKFNDSLTEMSNNANKLGVRIGSVVIPALNEMIKFLGENETVAWLFDTAVRNIGGALKFVAQVGVIAFEGLKGIILELVNYINGLINTAVIAPLNVALNLASKLPGVNLGQVQAFQTANVGDAATQVFKDAKQGLDRIDLIGKPEQGPPAPGEKKTDLKFNPKGAASNQDAANADALDKWIKKEQEAITTLRQEADYIGKTSIEVEKLKAARKLDAEFAVKTVGMAPSVVAKYKAEEEAIKKTRLEVMQLNYEQARTAQAGASEFFSKYVEDATNAAEQTKKVLGDAFSGLEDAMVNFTTTGKLNFTDLANSIVKDLARILVQQTITGPLSSALGGLFKSSASGGGLFSAVKGIFGFASGGDHAGGLRIVGENGPELEATGPSRIFNASQTQKMLSGGGGGGDTVVSVTVNMQDGGTSTGSNTNKGEGLGKAIAAAVRSTILDEKRPGGLLAA